MTQSPPKAAPSSRPPPPAITSDAGRRITALAAGGAVLLLTATAVALWPRTYGTEATFVIDGNADVQNPVALAGRVEAALLEREELSQAAMDLPPELRSPDPIGRLRAGIRVQSRGGRVFAVEFRGSDPESVQRIANRLVDRAVALLPKAAAVAFGKDSKPDAELATKTRAVTEFLTAHPEVTLEPPSGNKPGPAPDRGLEALRTEKRQIEQRLANPGTTDNPYAEPGDSPEVLNRRLAEIKTTIARREAALKQPSNTAPAASAELTSQWRALLADLAVAQARTLSAPAPPAVTGHVTVHAPLPSTPLTPNRLVLSIVSALLTLAAAMVAYVLPRKSEPVPRPARPATVSAGGRSDPPPLPTPVGAAAPQVNAGTLPLQAPAQPLVPAATGVPLLTAPGGSEPPGPIAVQRTVVLSSNSNPPLATAGPTRHKRTDPGGLEAPVPEPSNPPPANVGASGRPSQGPPPGLFGARPVPGRVATRFLLLTRRHRRGDPPCGPRWSAFHRCSRRTHHPPASPARADPRRRKRT